MAIARKPKASDADALKVIRKGGDVAKPTSSNDQAPKRVQLRLEQEILDRIDLVIESKGPPNPSRHFWILETIVARLKEEESK